MTNKWNLSKEYLTHCINKGIILLDNRYLSKENQEEIKEDISNFKRFLSGNYEDYLTPIQHYNSTEQIKKSILNKMKKHYYLFGEYLINWIINLNKANIFDVPYSCDQTEFSIDTQIEFTLKNYEKHSKYFLKYAKKILTASPGHTIQLIKDLETTSYCYYPNKLITTEPIIFIDPTECFWTLNHEIQHGIEYILNINPYDIYQELGPILFELLYTDLIYKEEGFIYGGDYQDRLDDIKYKLDSIYQYFTMIKIFAKTNFEVPTEKFKDFFLDQIEITNDSLTDFLHEQILGNGIDLDIRYVFSFLKAIELKNQIKKQDIDIAYVLEPYIRHNSFNFIPPKFGFQIYEEYTKEMHQKTRIK